MGNNALEPLREHAQPPEQEEGTLQGSGNVLRLADSENAWRFGNDGSLDAAARSSAAGGGLAGAGAAGDDFDLLLLGLLSGEEVIGAERGHVHVDIAAPDRFAAPQEQVHGLGRIEIASGGTAAPMTHAGGAPRTFRAAARQTLFLDFLADISP